MKTLPTPAPTKKKTVRIPRKTEAAFQPFDKQGRLRLGYASGIARIRPGVDLTKRTAPAGKSL